ncbi:porin [Pararoseomonas sp. SCSIO 73927]|uniref:porin n=1 Tax=Pararoseomonas sp. SCSIO 73927 TaxID=3114537 RepID=UPI0030CEE42A
MRRSPVLAFALMAALPAAAQEARPDGLRWDGIAPTLQLAEGNFTVRPLVRLDADLGSFFGQDEPGGFRSGVNLRRGRLGLGGTVLRDFTYTFVWEFGGSAPNDYNNIYEAQIAYTGLGWATIRAGLFTPQHMPEYAGSSFDLPFMERAAITNLAASLATGDTREAAGIEGRGELGGGGARWNASAYVTGGVGSTPHDGRQRGAAGRAVVLLPPMGPVQFQIGADVAAQFHPGTDPGPQAVRLRDYPELRVDSRRFLDSGSIRAGQAWAVGPEAAGRVGPLYLEAVWQRLTVEPTDGPTRRFDGWYVEGLLTVIGPARERSNETGTWRRPKAEGRFGSVEVGLRYSTADLGATRQSIWTAGVNWYLTDRFRLQAQYENGRTGESRDFQAIGMRASFNL